MSSSVGTLGFQFFHSHLHQKIAVITASVTFDYEETTAVKCKYSATMCLRFPPTSHLPKQTYYCVSLKIKPSRTISSKRRIRADYPVGVIFREMIVLIANSLPSQPPKSLGQEVSNILFLSMNVMWVIPRWTYLLSSLPCKFLRDFFHPCSNLPSGGLCGYWEQQDLLDGLRKLGEES